MLAKQNVADRKKAQKNALDGTVEELQVRVDSYDYFANLSDLQILVTGPKANDVLNLRDSNKPSDHYIPSLGMRTIHAKNNILRFYSLRSKPKGALHAIAFCIDTSADINKQMAELHDIATKYPSSIIFVVGTQVIQCPYLQTSLTQEDSFQSLHMKMTLAVSTQKDIYKEQQYRLTTADFDEPFTHPASPRCTIS